MKNSKPYDLSLRWLGSELECVVVIKDVDRDTFGFNLSHEVQVLLEEELDKAITKHNQTSK